MKAHKTQMTHMQLTIFAVLGTFAVDQSQIRVTRGSKYHLEQGIGPLSTYYMVIPVEPPIQMEPTMTSENRGTGRTVKPRKH